MSINGAIGCNVLIGKLVMAEGRFLICVVRALRYITELKQRCREWEQGSFTSKHRCRNSADYFGIEMGNQSKSACLL